MAIPSLKILIVAGQLGRDGSRWPLAPLLDRLEQRGMGVQVLCLSRAPELGDDVRVLEIPALASRWLRAFAIRGLRTDENLERPDVFHVLDDDMADIALDLSDNLGLPYIQSVSQFGSLDRGLRVSRRWCRRLVATSRDLASELIGALGVPGDRLVVIPPGIAPAVALSAKPRDGRVPVIGTGGPFEEASGMMVFLDAARLVLDAGHDVEFLIAAGGSQQFGLRHYAQRLRIADRVTIAHYTSVRAEFWSVVDIYCQPALVASSGTTLIQSLARAVPCVATDVPGLRELIEHGENGLIVPPRDAPALKAAIVAILDHPEVGARLGSLAQTRARVSFDPNVEADRLSELYQSACGD
jgi:glycosyltransferase involved in cell wall biosynthesis